jgi:hypothetical protein
MDAASWSRFHGRALPVPTTRLNTQLTAAGVFVSHHEIEVWGAGCLVDQPSTSCVSSLVEEEDDTWGRMGWEDSYFALGSRLQWWRIMLTMSVKDRWALGLAWVANCYMLLSTW